MKPLVLACSAFICANSSAYEFPTHNDLSKTAAGRSRLKTDPALLKNLGLLDPAYKYPATAGADSPQFVGGCAHSKKYEIVDLIGCGAQFEDIPLLRVLNHFYEPKKNTALTLGKIQVPGKMSPDWALEDTEEISGQKFSYKDARKAFYDALTTVGPQEKRDAQWGRLFETLGHVVHHLQDMVQPQHVRDDAHLTLPVPFLHNPSRYEHFTAEDKQQAVVRARMEGPGGEPVFVQGGSTYFKKPRDFWKNDAGRGIADIGNRDFVTAGTNFTLLNDNQVISNAGYPLPSFGGFGVPVPIAELNPPVPVAVQQYCADQGGDICAMTFAASEPTITASRNEKASVLSIYDQYVRLRPFPTGSGTDISIDRVFTLNTYVFEEAHKRLLPTAVGFSAGLINYFFRGAMEISPPDEGVYGIVDHADPSGNVKDTGGFFKIKLKLKNVTVGANGTEPMNSLGKLHLVAKFHRNNCYTPSLSGEYGAPDVNIAACRSKDEEIVLSDEQSAPAGLEGEAKPITFIFQNPIPINATDLFLQVVYKGELGDEKDAVVVATKDISEPVYVMTYMRWDQYTYRSSYPVLDSGSVSFSEWCTGGITPAFASVDACKAGLGYTLKVKVHAIDRRPEGFDPTISTIPQDTVTALAERPAFSTPLYTSFAPIGSFTRVAYLLDADTKQQITAVTESYDKTLSGGPAGDTFRWQTGQALTTKNQEDPVTKVLTPSRQYLPGRGVYMYSDDNLLLTSKSAGVVPPDLVLVTSDIKF